MKEGGNTIWYRGNDTKHEHGVAFIVKKELVKSVMNIKQISSRIILLRISASPMNLSVVQVYALTNSYDDETVEEFYELIGKTLITIPNKDFIIIQGDWNAKVGGDGYEAWSNAIGRYGLGKTNERGFRLLEFAQKHKLVLANTIHPQKNSRKSTWHSLDGKMHSQIDFILTPKGFKSSINKASTRTYH